MAPHQERWTWYLENTSSLNLHAYLMRCADEWVGLVLTFSLDFFLAQLKLKGYGALMLSSNVPISPGMATPFAPSNLCKMLRTWWRTFHEDWKVKWMNGQLEYTSVDLLL